MAPYFPADQQRRFLNAHRLFGVRNIQRTLQRTRPDLQSDAMQALTYEANSRAADPVGGAARVISEPAEHYKTLCKELVAVHEKLELCRPQQAAAAAARDTLIANDPLADPASAMLFAGAGAVAGPSQNEEDAMVDAFYADQPAVGESSNVQAGGGFQEQYIKDESQVQPPPQQHYEHLYHGAAGDEGSSHAWISSVVGNVQHCGDGEEQPMGLSDQLRPHFQIEAAAFDVKAAALARTTDQHHGNATFKQPEQKVVASSSAAAAGSSSSSAAHCQLQFGCSSNAWNNVGAHVN
uniref:LOB domain-containing protein n=1 Tax=Oryza brachyantha TaxID=4533 RepID=J3MWW5_ORYBR